jgi:hypothetical protein
MHTICIVHGVGFFRGLDKEHKVKYFCDQLSSKTGANCIYYNWDHSGKIPDDPARDTWFFSPIRRFVDEVIMDYSYVLKNMTRLISALPVADMYVAHSAGGMIVGSGTAAPQMLMGCPLQLVLNLTAKAVIPDVVNIMHYRDPVATPMQGVDNIVVDRPSVFPLIDVIIAHMSYWTNDAVIDIAAEFYKEHFRI